MENTNFSDFVNYVNSKIQAGYGSIMDKTTYEIYNIKDRILSINSKDGTQVAYKYIDEFGKPYFKIEPKHEKED